MVPSYVQILCLDFVINNLINSIDYDKICNDRMLWMLNSSHCVIFFVCVYVNLHTVREIELMVFLGYNVVLI